MRTKRVNVFLAFLMLLMLTIAPATTSVATDVANIPTTSSQLVDPLAVISQAKRADPQGLAHKIAELQTSDALMALFDDASVDDTQTYLEFFAASSSEQQVVAFVANTRGKHFVVDESKATVNGQPNFAAVSLVSGMAFQPRNCCHCWRAWVASAAYFVGSQMTCAPFYAIGGVAGFVCDGVFWAIGQLPDFDNACR